MSGKESEYEREEREREELLRLMDEELAAHPMLTSHTLKRRRSPRRSSPGDAPASALTPEPAQSGTLDLAVYIPKRKYQANMRRKALSAFVEAQDSVGHSKVTKGDYKTVVGLFLRYMSNTHGYTFIQEIQDELSKLDAACDRAAHGRSITPDERKMLAARDRAILWLLLSTVFVFRSCAGCVFAILIGIRG
jgi:hypothetical protein